jgi:hypothetical protein
VVSVATALGVKGTVAGDRVQPGDGVVEID